MQFSRWPHNLILLCLLCFNIVCAFDYYAELGLSKEASDDEIKASFRKLSLKYHPDKNKGDQEAQKRFMRINEAYDALSDPDKRQIYDIYGEDGLKNQGQQAQGWDPFAGLFGGGQQGGRKKGPDFRMDLRITLEELYSGSSKVFSIQRKVLCKKCRGTGAKDGQTKVCPTCKGTGVVTTIQQLGPGFNVQMQRPCDRCGGKGKTHSANCPVCRGEKVIDERKELTAIIERGMPDGHEIVFERMSEQSPDAIPGNVIVKLSTETHPRFKRRGNDLLHSMTISLKEALLGFRKTIHQLDGREIDVVRNQITPPGFVMNIVGEGMPFHNVPSKRGVMEITFTVAFPRSISASQKAELETLMAGMAFQPYVAPTAPPPPPPPQQPQKERKQRHPFAAFFGGDDQDEPEGEEEL
jgi:DnaJ-related protein SCJ1